MSAEDDYDTAGEYLDFDGAPEPEPEPADPYAFKLTPMDPAMRGLTPVLRIRDGRLQTVYVDKGDHFSKWKGMHRIMAIPDEKITLLFVRPNGRHYFWIDGVQVSHGHGRSKTGYFCSKVGHSNGCPHIKRIAQFRKDNGYEQP